MCQPDLLHFGGFTVLTQLLLRDKEHMPCVFLKVNLFNIETLPLVFKCSAFPPASVSHSISYQTRFYPFCTSTFIGLFCGLNIHQGTCQMRSSLPAG